MTQDLTRRQALVSAAALGGGALMAASAASLRSAASPPLQPNSRSLRDRAAAKGLLFGTAVLDRMLTGDGRLAEAIKTECNVLVPEIELKWSIVQPSSPDHFDFDAAERVYAFAHANGMKMRGHTLTWYRAIPKWAPSLIDGMTPGKAGDFLENYVRTMVGHWKGRIVQWDVVNEAIDGRQLLTEPLFAKKLGERAIDIAFTVAHETDPAAQLVFNTDLIEMDDPYEERHRVATLVLLERLVGRGVPVHALGIESHLSSMKRYSPSVFRDFLDKVTAMKLGLMATEFDIEDRGFLGMPEKRDAEVAALAKAYLDTVFSYRQMQGLLTWSLTDRYSWIRLDPTFTRRDTAAQRPSPLDEDYRRKPLWSAIAAAIDAAPGR